MPDNSSKSRIRAALWSVYFHSFYVRTLRRSVFDHIDGPIPFRPIPLPDAIQILLEDQDSVRPYRQLRALRRMERAGFLDQERWNRLRRAADEAGDAVWQKRLLDVEAKVKQLASALDFDLGRLVTPRDGWQLLNQHFTGLNPTCQTLNPTCIACHNPSFPPTDRPATTVTARALFSRTPDVIAKLFDPRSWGTCFDCFETTRVDRRADGAYVPHTPDPDQIGQPWDPATVPHLISERVTIEDSAGGSNVFTNVLSVTLFEVSATHARLEFDLRESTGLDIPSLGVDMPTCVDIDKGHMDASLLVGPGTGGPWSQVEVVKTVQFVDIDQGGGSNPLGLDGGELLNYLAPAILCLWLEDLTQGAVCCPA